MSLDAIQAEYREVVREALDLCLARFRNRLEAFYVAGSVANGEAWPGASDVDAAVFLSDEPTSEDAVWRADCEKALLSRHPVARDLHLNTYATSFLLTETMLMKFILRYNGVCLFGPDHLTRVEQSGASIPAPGPALAKARLGWVEQCIDGLAKRRVPDALFGGAVSEDLSALSADDYLATRKLARHFVLLEGAHVLMLIGDFVSFRRGDVLPRLAERFPQWQLVLRQSAAVLLDPLAARVPPAEFVEQILPFAQWMVEQTAKD